MLDRTAFYFRSGGTPHIPPGELIELAKVLLNLGQEGADRASAALASAGGYLSDDRLKAVLADALGTADEVTDQVAKLVRVGESLLRNGETPATLVGMLETVAGTRAGSKSSALSSEELSQLGRLLPIVVRIYPARERQAKAERLADGLGLRAEAIDLICDLRPVFNDERSVIEGLIPVSTLRIVASGVSRFPESFEAVLSVRDVLALQKKVDKAVSKLNALGRLAEQTSLPIPAVELTETDD